jgi:hypothetical protein
MKNSSGMGNALDRISRAFGENSYKQQATNYKKERPAYVTPLSRPQVKEHIPSADFVPSDTSNLQAGQKVEHQKFGFGEVIKMEGAAHNPIATVQFELNGEKKIMIQLLNKFFILQKLIIMKKNFFIAVCLFISLQSFSQVAGIWKGTSICQVKDSPCNDESVVYHISAGKSSDSFYIQANKIVNGVEEDMGTLGASYDSSKHLLTAHFSKNDTWEFKLNGTQMDGTLIYNKELYRIIKLRKEK